LYVQAYLSLAEGTATAAGLIAMMTDHYNILVKLNLNAYNIQGSVVLSTDT
jgi:hypothetical protein